MAKGLIETILELSYLYMLKHGEKATEVYVGYEHIAELDRLRKRYLDRFGKEPKTICDLIWHKASGKTTVYGPPDGRIRKNE